MSFIVNTINCRAARFARALNAAMKPKERNFGDDHGDPDQLNSCRTGEFGGFAAWSQLLHQMHFGSETKHQSVDAYFGWLFNRGQEDNEPEYALFY